MTPEAAKSLKPGTMLWYVPNGVSLSDGPDIEPGRCCVFQPEAGMRQALGDDIWINAGGWYLTWPSANLHVEHRDAMTQIIRMLREARVKVDRALAGAFAARDQGPRPECEEDLT
jgi:hypothetical protein